MNLSAQELAFLKSQGLSAADVFDGSDMPTGKWKQLAKAAGKSLVLGAPCRDAGHRIRLRAGHCFQCDPKKYSYQKRYGETGFIYIAGSLTARLIKIGQAVDCRQREKNLNGQAYGGVSDWVILFHMKVPESGRFEHEARRLLSNYIVRVCYDKDGEKQIAGELLRCSFGRALKALLDALGDGRPIDDPWRSKDHVNYKF